MQRDMNGIGRSGITQWVIVLCVIFSWIAISNHCAFAAVAAHTETPLAACPFHPKPAKQKEQSTLQCCKILRAVVSTAAKSWVRDQASFCDVDLYLENFVLIATPRNAPLPLLLDTGPPRARSFAELILQRCIFAHAPPSHA